MLVLLDKQIQLHMGHANVRYWNDDIMPLLTDAVDPLGVEDLATHKLPLVRRRMVTKSFRNLQKKQDGAMRNLLQP
jgi:hypothetical protein